MMTSSWSLAIDVGTSNTAAAWLRDGRVEPIRLDTFTESMPSGVFRDGDAFVVGRAAENRMQTSPGDFEPYPKTLLGRAGAVLGGKLIDPVDLVAAVLRHVRLRAVSVAGTEHPDRLWLTHPDEWTASRRGALREAAVRAGFDPKAIRLVSEPIAAASFYAGEGEVPAGARVAVFDSGGGTTDVAVLESLGDEFRVLASAGDERLGGNDFDERIRSWVVSTVRARGDEDLMDEFESSEGFAARLMLMNAIRRAKEELSEYPRVPIALSVSGRDTQVSLTRLEYEALISEDVARAGRLLADVLEQAGCAPGDLAAVYLTGGTAQTPALAAEVRRIAGRAPATLSDPKLVVARGALHLGTETAAPSARAARPTPAVARTADWGLRLKGLSKVFGRSPALRKGLLAAAIVAVVVVNAAVIGWLASTSTPTSTDATGISCWDQSTAPQGQCRDLEGVAGLLWAFDFGDSLQCSGNSSRGSSDLVICSSPDFPGTKFTLQYFESSAAAQSWLGERAPGAPTSRWSVEGAEVGTVVDAVDPVAGTYFTGYSYDELAVALGVFSPGPAGAEQLAAHQLASQAFSSRPPEVVARMFGDTGR